MLQFSRQALPRRQHAHRRERFRRCADSARKRPRGRSYHAKARPPKSLPKGKRPSLSNMKDDETGEPLMLRPDDTAAMLKDRLKAYHEETEPIIAYYTDAGVVARVDGNEAEKCWKQSAQALNVSP